MEFIKTKLIALLGLKNLYAEMQELRGELEDMASQYEDTKYLVEELETELADLNQKADDFEYSTDNIRTDLESDFKGLKDEINQMKEGYVLDVKLTREVY